MIVIESTPAYLGLFALAVGLGVIGGFANELLQTVRGRIGNLRMPRYEKGNRLVYLGFLGPLVLGGVAAAIVLVFLPLGSEERTEAGGAVVVERTYDPLQVVPLSLAAGVAGSAVLIAAQTRLVTMVSQQKAQFLEASVSGSLERAAAEAADKAGEEIAAKLAEIKPKVEAMLAGNAAAATGAGSGAGSGGGDIATPGPGGGVTKAGVVFGGGPTAADVDALFSAAASDATRAVRARLGEVAAAEKRAILDAARAFDRPSDPPRPPESAT